MKKNILRMLAVLIAAGPAIVSAQAPKDAIIVSDADVKAVLKLAADTKRTIPDNTIRVIDMGSYQLGVAVVHRAAMGGGGATAPRAAAAVVPATPCGERQPGATGPNGILHNDTAETYFITSGSGTLITGGTIVNGR